MDGGDTDTDVDEATLPMGGALGGFAAPATSSAAAAIDAVIDDGLLDMLEEGGSSVSATKAEPLASSIAISKPPPPPMPTAEQHEELSSVLTPLAMPPTAAPLPSPPAPAEPSSMMPPVIVPPCETSSSLDSPIKFKRASTQPLDEETMSPSPKSATMDAVVDSPETVVLLASMNSATAPDIILGAKPVTVGRDESSTVVLTDPRVSAKQFVVQLECGLGGVDSSKVYWLEDFSTNGTLVSKKIIKSTKVKLCDCDLIEILPQTKVGRESAIAFLFRAPKGMLEKDDVAPQAKRQRVEGSVVGSSAHDDSKVAGTDALFEGAMCIICQEILHRATSVLPCMHSFCSSCLSGWLQRPGPGVPKCPLCRNDVTRVSRNHTLDALIDGLLKAHPERRRSTDVLSELDKHDRLTDVGYDLARLRGGGHGVGGLFGAPIGARPGSTDSSASDSGDESDDDDGDRHRGHGPRCFHCAAPVWQPIGRAAGTVASRAVEAADLVQNALSRNVFERNVLEEWLASKGLSLAAAVTAILADPHPAGAPPIRVRLERAAFGGGAGAAADGTIMLPEGHWTELQACRSCVFGVLKAVVYAVRERIPDSELPARARGRPVCWYGRQCRTQGHKHEHAARLNHVCERTRF